MCQRSHRACCGRSAAFGRSGWKGQYAWSWLFAEEAAEPVADGSHHTADSLANIHGEAWFAAVVGCASSAGDSDLLVYLNIIYVFDARIFLLYC